MFNRSLFALAVCVGLCPSPSMADQPHAVVVVGTHHYSPHKTMPALAQQLEKLGFRTTVVAAEGNPERDSAGLPNLSALRTADVAIFYVRFLTLPESQMRLVVEYLESGKPVVGLRTSTHAFDYPVDHPLSAWNDGFGRRVLGTKYFMHLAGTTKVRVAEAPDQPNIGQVAFAKPKTVAGTLYLVRLPENAKVLLEGTGKAKRVGTLTNRFGTHQVRKRMTQPVAWTWENEWKGRVFGTTLGHPSSFEDPAVVRLIINGICWAANKPIPEPRTPIAAIKDGQLVAQAGRRRDAKSQQTGQKPNPPEDPEYAKYAIFEATAQRPEASPAATTRLPLALNRGDKLALIGNSLLDRTRHFGYFETAVHQAHVEQQLVMRNLSWPADTPTVQPRPMNFADLQQHLTHIRADVILAAFGFNESFQGPDGLEAFQQSLGSYVNGLRSLAFNGSSSAKVVLISPIANENVLGVPAADLNNQNIELYVEAIRKVAAEQQVAFIDLFTPTKAAMADANSIFTINGVHLNDAGYQLFATELFRQLFGHSAPATDQQLRQVVIDKNRQFFRRYRPANTFYYTGGRNKSYGYLDFLPAMKNFDLMVANRDRQIWAFARGDKEQAAIDDSNIPPLPESKESRGANEYLSAEQELEAFAIDPRFEVNLFAGEEEFADLGAPIQIRWDSRGRLWVACSTTYPHVYPGNEPNDKLVILEDTDQDGRADKSTVFADNLHIPLSFEFGDGGVYVSEMPDLTFIKDTDGDGKADLRRRVLSGFGTEDSHHALHDLTWTPDGDLIFREGIFHHSQVETPYGPVRQRNSGWFRFQPRDQRLTGFGTYHSTNPWGVTFDEWGQHVASHPIYAEAFHALDPPYPTQHPRPTGLQAYSGTCGQEFVDFASWPAEMQGGFVKVRYKPTNRVEFHKWKEGEFGYEEEYVGDIIFSSNLSFIPVDLRYGPRGAMYVCDWYNPVKGHAQYSLRDSRRDRHSGRIWRIVPKGAALTSPPEIANASIPRLLDVMKRPEYRYRYWAKRELRTKEPQVVADHLEKWVSSLDPADPRFRHHQLEAIWNYRNVGRMNTALLRELLECDEHHARAAAMKQLRYWHSHMPDALSWLRRGVNDERGLVRMQAAIAASYIGTKDALDAVLAAFRQPHQKHLTYALMCAVGSKSLRQHWEGDPSYQIARLLKDAKRANQLKEPTPSASEAEFDRQPNLKAVRISCQPERMLYTVKQFVAQPGQPVKLVFSNPDATDHNLLIVNDGALEEVGMAANEMAKDPRHANSNFIPTSKRHLIVQAAPMIGPTRKSRVHVLRFRAPTSPGVYPYVCTFPGHWVIMRGDMVVADTNEQVDAILAARKPSIVQEWRLRDFTDLKTATDEATVMRGMQSFMKANCHQCHVVGGHGIELGPDLTDVRKRFQGQKLLQQIVEPSAEIHKAYQAVQVIDSAGNEYVGVIKAETETALELIPNLLTPNKTVSVPKAEIDVRAKSTVSSMPAGLINVLNKQEVSDLVSFLEAGGYHPPDHLKGKHNH